MIKCHLCAYQFFPLEKAEHATDYNIECQKSNRQYGQNKQCYQLTT